MTDWREVHPGFFRAIWRRMLLSVGEVLGEFGEVAGWWWGTEPDDDLGMPSVEGRANTLIQAKDAAIKAAQDHQGQEKG